MSIFSTLLRLTLQAAGENTATCGDVANQQVFQLLEAAVAGATNISTTGGTTTLTTNNGASDQARAAILNVTGALTSNATIKIPQLTKTYLVNNQTTGNFTLTISSGAGATTVVAQGGPTLVMCDGTNVLNTNSVVGAIPNPLNLIQAPDIASAATINIGSMAGNYAHVTGTTGISSFGAVPQAGCERRLEFTGALTLSNGGSLILPGNANITTAAGDSLVAVGEAGNVWRVVSYTLASAAPGVALSVPTPLNLKQATDLASAATTSIGNIAGNYVHITGTTTITSFGTVPQAGCERILEFTGALTLTNGASLILPGGANITTAAGDTAIVVGEASNVWRVISYVSAAQSPIRPKSLLNVQAFMAHGSGTYTPTAGTKTALAFVQGAGGAGGASPSSGLNLTDVHAGTGGGSGTLAVVLIQNPVAMPYSVGAGGVPTSGAPTAGGNSVLGSASNIATAPGGSPGSYIDSNLNGLRLNTGGSPGGAPSVTGFTTVYTNVGQAGVGASTAISAGNSVFAHSGDGGDSPLGGGGGKTFPLVFLGSTPTFAVQVGYTGSGIDASTPGAGGAGVSAYYVSGVTTGGAGADGCIIIYEFS